MNASEKLFEAIGNVDIYLIDQILKDRYSKDDLILDAGCGSGRNIKWFAKNDYNIWGVDNSPEAIETIKHTFPNYKDNFRVEDLTKLPFKDEYFNHIICNAVLHFAQSEAHFITMIAELIRVLKQSGSLFIRMTSNFGMPYSIKEISKGIYLLPDETHRFLLTKELLEKILNDFNLKLLEPVKTTNVQDLRWMTTLVLMKK